MHAWLYLEFLEIAEFFFIQLKMIGGKLPHSILFYVVLILKLTLTDLFSLDGIISELYKFSNVERCDHIWIPNNLTALEYKLETNLYGQPLASKVIISALKGHFETPSSTPLTLSFHGGSGVGKTYVLQFITDSLYKRGSRSKFVHSFIGSMHFPIAKNIEEYKEGIEKTILGGVNACSQSLFVFDEVHHIQPGVLNKISSLIRYSRLKKHVYDLSKAIFIFISNTGFEVISDSTLQFLKKGVSRDEFKLSDFERDVMEVAFKEGGLKGSDLMSNSLIDHFVPFLPLEEVHVIKCIKAELQNQHLEYLFSESLVQEVIKEAVIYGPEPHNLFSQSGCKRISQKLSVIIFSDKYKRFISNNKVLEHVEL